MPPEISAVRRVGALGGRSLPPRLVLDLLPLDLLPQPDGGRDNLRRTLGDYLAWT